MSNKKKIFLGVLALIVVASNVTLAEAAKKNKEEQKNIKVEEKKEPIPVIIEGDDITFNEQTGEIYAKGKVVFTQADAVVTGTDIEGNTIKTKVWAKDKTLLTQPDLKLNGYETDYNYGDRTGTMKKVDGVVNNKIVKGNNVEFYPERVVIYNGTITKCPAIKPDYHISAKKIEIYPNVEMIAYNVKVWVKDKLIYSRDRYKVDLSKKENNDILPSVGYDSDDGIYIGQNFSEPITEDLTGFYNLNYYSKSGFKPQIGLNYKMTNISVNLVNGYFKDDDSKWIKKEPELSINSKHFNIADSQYNYYYNIIYGKWTDSYKTSWHQDYNIYVYRTPIKINEKLFLNYGTGYEIIKESYNNSIVKSYKYNIGLSNQFFDKFSGWINYNYTQNNSSIFEYDSTNVAKELVSGISYSFDEKNSIVISQSYDLEHNKLVDRDFTWYKDLHCWQASITYRSKRSELQLKINMKDW